MTKNTQLNQPPRTQPSKPIVSFDNKSFPPLQQQQPNQTPTTQQSNTNTATPTVTAPAYDYCAELNQITKELETMTKTKFENAITQLDTKFTQCLDQIDQKFECYLHQMEPIAKVSATLQTTQDNQACDISQLTQIMANLNQKFDAILDCIPNIQTVVNSLTLLHSVGQS